VARRTPCGVSPEIENTIMNLDVFDCNRNKIESVPVSPGILDREPNRHLLYEVVKMQLAKKRQGNAATKTRSMVRGGGKKPWKQKGTGRARAGTIRSPIWVGGGTVFGPQPRSYEIKIPKKAKKNALRVALSSKADSMVLIDGLSFEKPRTKDMVSLLGTLQLTGKVLIVLDGENQNVQKSANNLQGINVIDSCGVNVLDVLNHDFLLFEKAAFNKLQGRLS